MWTSGSRRTQKSIPDISVVHEELFARVEKSIANGFGLMQAALVQMQLDIQAKLRTLKASQSLAIESYPASSSIEFEENVKKINRSLESFQAHANNLSHIKLTLARAANFVSEEGNLALLVCPPKKSSLNPMAMHFPDTSSSILNPPKEAMCDEEETIHFPVDWSEMMMRTVDESFDPTIGPKQVFPQALPHSFYSNPGSNSLDQVLHPNKSDLMPIQLRSEKRVENATCFVFYLPPSVTDDILRKMFNEFGTIYNTYVAVDKVSKRSRGFGFVDFSTPAEAQRAVREMDQKKYENKILSVSIKVGKFSNDV